MSFSTADDTDDDKQSHIYIKTIIIHEVDLFLALSLSTYIYIHTHIGAKRAQRFYKGNNLTPSMSPMRLLMMLFGIAK